MAYNLVTRDEYKFYASIKSNNFDSEIDNLITRVSTFVKNYCKCTFVDYIDVSTPKIEYFNGGTSSIILTESPVVSVVSLQYSSDYGQLWTDLVENVDFILDGDELFTISNTEWPFIRKGYKVTYTAGYTDVPYDLALAVMDLITYYRKNDQAIHSNKAPGSNTVQIEYISSTSLPVHIRRILDLYMADYR